MSEPHGFSWVEKPLLAALARPESEEDFTWLREHGIELLVSLTEEPPRRMWVNNAGLLLVHVPVDDMTAPTQEQLDQCIQAIIRAHARRLGAAVYCGAGLGRTGTILAAYFVHKGESARTAIAHVRKLRPGSVETDEQEEAIQEYARRHRSD
jgi:atypical dual specificity phosphatase